MVRVNQLIETLENIRNEYGNFRLHHVLTDDTDFTVCFEPTEGELISHIQEVEDEDNL